MSHVGLVVYVFPLFRQELKSNAIFLSLVDKKMTSDLGVSGRILVRTPEGKIQSRLVKITDAVARVSNLCIHLQSAEERKAFKVNKEDHTSPILATEAELKIVLEEAATEQLNNSDAATTKGDSDAWSSQQEPLLLQLIADQLQVSVDQIADFELNLYDTQGAALGGVAKEFLYSARLDNLATVFVGMEAILSHAKDGGMDDDEDIKVVVFFDHEVRKRTVVLYTVSAVVACFYRCRNSELEQ